MLITATEPWSAGLQATEELRRRLCPGDTTAFVHLAALFAGWCAQMVTQGIPIFDAVSAWEQFQAGASAARAIG